MQDRVKATVERCRSPFMNMFEINGIYRVEHLRAGKLLSSFEVSNTVTTEGKRYLIDAALLNSAGGYTEKIAWYVGLVDNAQTHDTPAVGLVYDTFFDVTHNTEFTGYSGGARKAWTGVIDGANAPSATNTASKAAFTFTSAGVLYGAALVSLATHSDHTAGDYLMSYAAFSPATLTVQIADVVNIAIELAFT